MSKIEYLIRRYAGEYSKLHHASYWEAEMNWQADIVYYFYERLRRKGITLRNYLSGVKLAIERSENASIRSGSEVDCEIKKLVAIIRLRKKGQR